MKPARRPPLPLPLCAALLVALLGMAGPAGAAPSDAAVTARAPAPASAARALHALFDADWEARMARSPEYATRLGDHRRGDQLDEATPEREAMAWATTRRHLASARAIDERRLGEADRLSRALFIHQLEDELAYEPLVGLRRLQSLGALWGVHTQLADLLQAAPVGTVAQVEQLLKRLQAYPRRIDQEIARLREGRSLGWVAPQPVLARVLATLDQQLASAAADGPFFLPWRQLGTGIPAADAHGLRERALALLQTQVLPAQRRLREYIATELLPEAPASGALSSYPDGARAYAQLVRSQTTTTLTPQAIHDIGLREVARLRAQVAEVMREMDWRGDYASFVQHLNTDPKYFVRDGEALLAAYRDVAKRIDAGLPRLFAELPRVPYGVRAMPAFSGPDRAEYYDGPPLDGSGPGWFNANAQGWRTRPIWGLETLTAHEAVPGHHLQTARAMELGTLPRFRRTAWYVAYGEGWALYAETLGFQLGLYRTPESRYGHLQMQMLRAARLVVDTGLHALGWPRERAIDYMLAETGLDRGFVTSEVDRYISTPGQALGYMIGQLKIIELRERARERLGERFDLRRFHNVVLDQGPVPLTVLEREVDAWIARQAQPASSPSRASSASASASRSATSR